MLLPAGLLVLPEAIGFLLLDALAVDLRGIGLRTHEVEVHGTRCAPGDEHERERREDDPREDFLALEGVADFLEHGVDGSFGRAGSLMKPPSARHRHPCHNTPP